ncbi:hypothetical protein ANN_08476 [Periplaneta americana]|uniref:Reverse transcriptase domain-containing protein n=1 Tax=Periplaneta americana TaxID=6978 RepID=A0ABQ8T1J0_PERAM|nr:hypothetical protein ANN_08476 [Periplaneta americana]
MLGENTQTIRENTEILLEASKAIGLEVNPEKTKYMIMSRDQNIVRNGNIKIGDLSYEGVENFKYLGATVTNINGTREEIKRRINMGIACYYSAEKLLSSSLLSKNLKVRIYKTVILPVLLYGCETWTLTLRAEQRLRVSENKVEPFTSAAQNRRNKKSTHGKPELSIYYSDYELRFIIGTNCCEPVIFVSVQSAASASATEIKDSRMQLRRATSAVHKCTAKYTQADGDIKLTATFF